MKRLEETLSKEEEERLRKVINNIGWGTGMRCTKCTPSFHREDELKSKIKEVKAKLAANSSERRLNVSITY